jgi:hypothetical protein
MGSGYCLPLSLAFCRYRQNGVLLGNTLHETDRQRCESRVDIRDVVGRRIVNVIDDEAEGPSKRRERLGCWWWRAHKQVELLQRDEEGQMVISVRLSRSAVHWQMYVTSLRPTWRKSRLNASNGLGLIPPLVKLINTTPLRTVAHGACCAMRSSNAVNCAAESYPATRFC